MYVSPHKLPNSHHERPRVDINVSYCITSSWDLLFPDIHTVKLKASLEQKPEEFQRTLWPHSGNTLPDVIVALGFSVLVHWTTMLLISVLVPECCHSSVAATLVTGLCILIHCKARYCILYLPSLDFIAGRGKMSYSEILLIIKSWKFLSGPWKLFRTTIFVPVWHDFE